MTNDIEKWENISREFAKKCENTPFKTKFLYPLVLSNLGVIKSKKMLDLGSSSGVFTRILWKKGAHPFGIDSSKRLLKIAEEKNPNRKITYLYADLNKKISFPSEYFDSVTALHILMDVENYQNVIRESFRLLKSGGKFIITIPHPCFSHPILYFKRRIFGRINFRWSKVLWNSYFERRKIDKQLIKNYATSYYHRTIGDYVNTIAETGFIIKGFLEPKLPKKIANEMGYLASNFFPNTMIIIAKKTTAKG